MAIVPSMKVLGNFLIAISVAWVLSWQVAPAFWHGVAFADIVALVTGNVTYFVNPETGNDSNSCLAAGSPCRTLQHAVYLLTNTLLWGINIGSAKISMAAGTYNEVVQVAPPIGFPKPCSACVQGGPYPAVIEFAGADAAPADVVLSAPNGTCNLGGTNTGAVLSFPMPGRYWIHGFTITATNEASANVCDDLWAATGAYVMATGTMDYGPPANGGDVIGLGEGGTYQQGFNSAVMNVTVGTTHASGLVRAGSGGHFYQDNSTINFIGSTTFSNAVYMLEQSGGWISTIKMVTYTGTLTGTYCYMASGSAAIFEGTNLGEFNTSFAGCASPAGVRVGLWPLVRDGANAGGMIVADQFATNISQGSAPTLSSCGTSPSIVATATDVSGTLTEGSVASGCTVNFGNHYPLLPDCTVSSPDNLGFTYAINGSAGSFTGFTVTNVGALSDHKLMYHCLHHM